MTQVPPNILTYFNVSAVLDPSAPLLPVYILCVFVGDASLEIAFTAIALVYGTDFFPVLHSEEAGPL